MVKNCYLHLGLHKTASSSFQITCSRNINLLKSFDITYPIFTCSAANKNSIKNHSIPIYSLLHKKPQSYRVNIKWNVSDQIKQVNKSYLEQLERYLEESNNIILSGEDISMLDKQSLKELVEKIKSYNFKVHIIALVRNPYYYFCSEIQQFIKGGRYVNLISLNGNPLNDLNLNIGRRSHIVQKLKSTFNKNIQFYSFEDACNHNYGPVGFLIDNYLKLYPSLFEYSRVNESLFNMTVRLQNEQNKLNPAILNNKLNPKYISLQHLNNNFNFSGKFLLTKKEFNIIEEIIYQENNKYLELTGINYKDELIKFSKPIDWLIDYVF